MQIFDQYILFSSNKESTEDFTGNKQECVSSPVVTDLKVAFIRDLYNDSFIPVTWDSLFVPFYFNSASVGGLVSMLRSSGTGEGRRVHLAGGGSGSHRGVQPIFITAIFAFHGDRVF